MAYQLTFGGGVLRLADGMSIPATEDCPDYRTYLAWLAAGNVPLPMAAECAALQASLDDTKHRNFLRQTDWYVIRSLETGVAIPPAVAAARASARACITT